MSDHPARPAGTSRSKTDQSRARGIDHRPPDYVVVGHICADILPDGTAVLGGTALYSALAAASLGWRTGILTRGRYGFPINDLQIPPLAINDDRIQIVIQDAEWPTCFVNEYDATGRRTQQIKRWAGQIDLSGMPPSWRAARVIHLGPIAQEIDVRQSTGVNPGFLGITPQGWMRDWPRATGGRVQAIHLRLPAEFVSQVDGIVVNDEEYVTSREIVDAIGKSGYAVVTVGEGGAGLTYPGGHVSSPGFKVPVVDLTGAGDVFSAAFFYRIADKSISPADALRFANAAAGLMIGGIATTKIPTRRASRQLIDQGPSSV